VHTVGSWPLGPQSPFWQSCSQGALPLCTHSRNCPSPTPMLCPHQVLVGPLFEPVQVPLVGSLPSTASPAPLSLVPAATLLRVHPTPLSASLIRTLESTTPKDGGISPSQGQQQVAECLEVMLSTHPHPPLKPTAATQRGQCSLLSCPTTPAQSMSIGLMEDNWRVYNLQTL